MKEQGILSSVLGESFDSFPFSRSCFIVNTPRRNYLFDSRYIHLSRYVPVKIKTQVVVDSCCCDLISCYCWVPAVDDFLWLWISVSVILFEMTNVDALFVHFLSFGPVPCLLPSVVAIST